MTDLVDSSRDDHMRLVDESDIVAQLLDRLHVMCRKDDGSSLLLQTENLLADDLSIDRVETRERLIKNKQGRLMHHRSDELDLLGHTL